MISSSARSLKSDAPSIVVVGDLNPAIFQPFWFAKNNLIREEEADEAKIEIVHQQAAVFSTAWFNLKVTDERFAVETQDSAKLFELRDLVVGTFAVLEHTPIRAFGLNSRQHFEVQSEEMWHAIGDHYAPKESWRGLFDEQPRVGMRSLTIQGHIAKSLADRIEINIEPSLAALPFGLFISVNYHYRVADANDKPGNVGRLLSVLTEHWEAFLEYRDVVSKHVFSEVQVR